MLTMLKRSVKSSKVLYTLYYYIGSLLLHILGLFVKTDDNLVLYVVYGGQRYDDSPRFIYEYLIGNDKYSQLKHVWAFISPEKMCVPIQNKIKIDTFLYYITALKAKYWITNSSVSRGLNFAKKNTINIYFQHGMAGIKKLGEDLNAANNSFRIRFHERFDYIVIEGKEEEKIIQKAWGLVDEKILNIGLPRNDELTKKSKEEVAAIKERLGIPVGRKVILYAPTFREYNKDTYLATYLAPPFDYDKWYEELGDEYILLLTAHYEVAKLMNVPAKHPFVINAFKYPYINELMLVSDILISDYSSIIFDYSILGRPIISYAYDFDQYSQARGIYPGYEKIFSQGIMKDQEEIVRFIKEMDYEAECEYTKKYIRERFITNYGNATEIAVKKIFG